MRGRINQKYMLILPRPSKGLAFLAIALAIPLFAQDKERKGQDRIPSAEIMEQIDKVIQDHPDHPQLAEAFQRRGIAHFLRGEFEESIRDFDRTIELEPDWEAHHWQRGICYYYSGEFEKGVKQFELHQTVNGSDVENAVWHFLCKAKLDGIESAREALIPISGDARVPMAEIWNLFSGKGSVRRVISTASKRGIEIRDWRQRMCYAHLYLGLYYEITDQPELANEYINLAATKYSMPNYMGDVALVHAKLLNTKDTN